MTDLVSRILNRVDGYLDTSAPLLARDRLRVGVRDVILQAVAEDAKAVSEDAVTAHAQALLNVDLNCPNCGERSTIGDPGLINRVATAPLAATREAEAERDRLLVLEKDLNIFLNQQCDARLKAEAKATAQQKECDALAIENVRLSDALTAMGHRAVSAEAKADAARREQRDKTLSEVFAILDGVEFDFRAQRELHALKGAALEAATQEGKP